MLKISRLRRKHSYWLQVLNNIGSQIRLYNGEKAEIISRSLRGISQNNLLKLTLMERALWLDIYFFVALNLFFVVVDRLAFSTSGVCWVNEKVASALFKIFVLKKGQRQTSRSLFLRFCHATSSDHLARHQLGECAWRNNACNNHNSEVIIACDTRPSSLPARVERGKTVVFAG